MKKFLSLSIISLLLYSCGADDRASTPKEIGPHVMVVLKDMAEITRPEFSKYFISAKELKEISKNKEVIKSVERRRIIGSTTEEAMKVRYTFMYKRLKSSGRSLGVKWAKIEFKKFEFSTREGDEDYFCDGVLFFTSNSRTFSLQTTSIHDGSEYILVSVDSLEEVVNQE